jgi:hypothetical protein
VFISTVENRPHYTNYDPRLTGRPVVSAKEAVRSPNAVRKESESARVVVHRFDVHSTEFDADIESVDWPRRFHSIPVLQQKPSIPRPEW